jgi:dTDP-4-amino-4,6-dideoxygalactose transaminase
VNYIPPLELTQQYQTLSADIGPAVLEILASGRYINGPVVQTFEEQFAAYIGTTDCIGCNSGTDALLLALRAYDIGPGDEVITTPFTFIATAEMISAVGATPVFVDIDPHTFNLDLNQVEAAICDRTKAIIPVHLFGQPVPMTQLMAIAQAHGLIVIEDCAQATGATWQGQTVGSIGHVGCFSFYPTKNLGACGDGGAVTTSDAAIAAKIRLLRNHGQPQTYQHTAIGINSRLDAIQAAILTVKLQHLDRWNAQRQAIADRYQALLAPLPDVVAPQAIAGGQAVWHQYTLRLITPDAAALRQPLRQQLQAQGVGSMVYYPIPLHQQPVYTHLGYRPGQLPIVEQVAQQVLSLPMYPELTPTQQETVVAELQSALAVVRAQALKTPA